MPVKTPEGKTVRKVTLQRLHREWTGGRSKASIERELGVIGQRGKWITRAFSRALQSA